MNPYKPQRIRNVVLKDLQTEFLIYSSQQKELHVLNPTAHLIWNLCDGEHSIEDIEKELRANFSIPAEAGVIGDIHSTLEVFRSKGLLENEAELTQPLQPESSS